MFTLLVNAWSMLETEENSFLKRGGNIFKEFIYNRKDFVKWRAYIYIYLFFFLHPQTSNVTQAKLKLLYHECNNPGNYSIRQPFDIRGCVEQTVSISIFISFIIETLKRSFSSKRIS